MPMLAVALAMSASEPAVASIEGLWLTPGRKSVVKVARCGDALCATIVAANPLLSGVMPKDSRNPNPALRSRSVVGVQLLNGFSAQGSVWAGTIYNPEDGRTYASSFSLAGDGTLAVKGCVVLLCQTQNWARAR